MLIFPGDSIAVSAAFPCVPARLKSAARTIALSISVMSMNSPFWMKDVFRLVRNVVIVKIVVVEKFHF